MQSPAEIVTRNVREYASWLDLDCLVNIANNLSFAEFEVAACQLFSLVKKA